MKLVEQWRSLEAGLPDDWAALQLEVEPETAAELPRVAALLAPANPGRVRNALRVDVVRRGPGLHPESLRRLLGRLDEERLWATLRLVRVEQREAADEAPAHALADRWAASLATLPPDWSDLLAELRLRSSDDLERAALLCAPLNPTRVGNQNALRFRVARRSGYGASESMVRRCLERCDREGIRGEVEILRVLSDTDDVATQGPVWRIDRRVA